MLIASVVTKAREASQLFWLVLVIRESVAIQVQVKSFKLPTESNK